MVTWTWCPCKCPCRSDNGHGHSQGQVVRDIKNWKTIGTLIRTWCPDKQVTTLRTVKNVEWLGTTLKTKSNQIYCFLIRLSRLFKTYGRIISSGFLGSPLNIIWGSSISCVQIARSCHCSSPLLSSSSMELAWSRLYTDFSDSIWG